MKKRPLNFLLSKLTVKRLLIFMMKQFVGKLRLQPVGIYSHSNFTVSEIVVVSSGSYNQFSNICDFPNKKGN